MSTKTTFKRIALVAVAALGLSTITVMGSISANAAIATNDTVTQYSATLNTATTTLAGRVGQQVTIDPTATWLVTTGSGIEVPTMSFAAAITTQPATSNVYPTINSGSAAVSGFGGYGLISSGSTLAGHNQALSV